jgi:hypothetical protein
MLAVRCLTYRSRPDGLPLRDPNHMRMWLGPGEKMSDFLDEYGQ